MQTVQVGELKRDFSNILKQVGSGEEFVVEYGKNHEKVAKIIPYKEKLEKRVFGQLKGKIDIPDDFNNESDEINNLFYSE